MRKCNCVRNLDTPLVCAKKHRQHFEDIIAIQVCGERVLSENRLERRRQNDQKGQEVEGVERVKTKRERELESTVK